MFVVVNTKSLKVFGPFDSEEIAIGYAKERFKNVHPNWYVEVISRP